MASLDRRDFMKLVGASAGAAAAAGCADPVEKLVPYVIQPETVTPGLPTFYASTCTECEVGCGLHIKTREGRPIKLEGNPDHPINQGTLCARGQASIGRTYHPDRYPRARLRAAAGEQVDATSDEAMKAFVNRLKSSGRKTWVLGGQVGPTLSSVIDAWVSGVGAGGRMTYEPIAHEALREATRRTFGVAALPIFDVSQADLIVDFASDFLDTGLSPTESAREFTAARDLSKHSDAGAPLVSVGPRLSMTASNASAWIPAAPGSEGRVALALAKAVYDAKTRSGQSVPGAETFAGALRGADLGEAASRAGVERSRLEDLAKKLVDAKAAIALPPGTSLQSTRATEAAAAVLVLNAVLGAVDTRVKIPQQETRRASASYADVKRLIDAMNAGQVDVLIVHDSNPVYSLPENSGFQEALDKVFLVSTASLVDETSVRADIVLPQNTSLESWGDALPRAGVRSLIQPTIRPLHDTKSLGDIFLESGRALGAEAALPKGSFRNVVEAAWSDTDWRKAVARGGDFSPTPTQPVSVAASAASLKVREPTLAGSGEYTLVAFAHSLLYDGRGAALPWLQEIPDPVTKVSWSTWVELSKATAKKLGVSFGDVVTVDTGNGSFDASVLPRGGVRDDVIAVPMGQGHTVGHYAALHGEGVPDEARGANVLSVLPDVVDEASGGRVFLGTKAKVTPTGEFRRLALSQWTDNQHKRGLVQEVSLLALTKDADDHHGNEDLAHAGQSDEGGHEFVLPFEPGNDADPDQPYRWGMTIDADKCNGCSACIAACYTENNVPIVGETQAIRHREMNWIRIERYIGEGEDVGGEARRPYPDLEELGVANVRQAPMLCQHCGSAPCESVCPVIATYHTPEGVNGMVYNRCVGTRYCANNCVYKVRRFNYFDYSAENWPGLLGLMLNPDVTVRGQGVMEKCTFCIQRIESARKDAKHEGRNILGNEVVTACQQTCPTQAITFGNTRDPDSDVMKAQDDPARKYHSLAVLNTRPGITYLAQVDRLPGDKPAKGQHDEGGH